MEGLFGILLFMCPFFLLGYLIFAGKDYLVNYERKLREIEKLDDSKLKYISGILYLVVSIFLIIYMIEEIKEFENVGYVAIILIGFVITITIVTTILKNTKISNIVLIVGIAIVLLCSSYSMLLGKNFREIGRVQEVISMESFNNRLTLYEGINDGNGIKALLSQVIESNEHNDEKIVTVEFGNDGKIITNNEPTEYKEDWNVNTKIKPNKKYRVKMQYATKGKNEGFINEIIISEVKKK